MKIITTTFGLKTEQKLRTSPVTTTDRNRGVYYIPDSDEVAYLEARPFFDRAALAIRKRMKMPEHPVSLHITMRDGALFAVCEATSTR